MSPRFWRPSLPLAPANHTTATLALLRRRSAATWWHEFGAVDKGGLLVLFTVLALCLCTCATLGYLKWRDSRQRRQATDEEQAGCDTSDSGLRDPWGGRRRPAPPSTSRPREGYGHHGPEDRTLQTSSRAQQQAPQEPARDRRGEAPAFPPAPTASPTPLDGTTLAPTDSHHTLPRQEPQESTPSQEGALNQADALAWVREQNQRAADNFESAPAAPLDYRQRSPEPNRRPLPLHVLHCPRPSATAGLRQFLQRYDSCDSGSGSEAHEDTPPESLTGPNLEAAAFEYFESARPAEHTPASPESTLFEQLLFETQQPLSTQPSSTESPRRQAAAWLDQCLDDAANNSHESPQARSNGPAAATASHHTHTSPRRRDLAARRARCLDWENAATTEFGAWYTAQQAAGHAYDDPEFAAWWTVHQAAYNAQPDTPRPAQYEDPTSNCSSPSSGASAGDYEPRAHSDRWATSRDKQALLEKLEYLEEQRANAALRGPNARVEAWSDGLPDDFLDPDTPPEPRLTFPSPRFNAFGDLVSPSPELPPAADNRDDDLVLDLPLASPELADGHGPVLYLGLLEALGPLLEQDPAVAHAVGPLLLHNATFEVVDDEDEGGDDDDDSAAFRSLHWSDFDGDHRDPDDDDD